MNVRIGVTRSPKELEVELADDADIAALSAQLEETLASERGVLWITDRRGRRVGVPAAKLAYVEFETVADDRRVGFGAAAK